jgi:hypothetical protein
LFEVIVSTSGPLKKGEVEWFGKLRLNEVIDQNGNFLGDNVQVEIRGNDMQSDIGDGHSKKSFCIFIRKESSEEGKGYWFED